MNTNDTNTILEINESHTDNFLLVIPQLPTAIFLGSSFQTLTKPSFTPAYVPSSSGQCGDGPEYVQSTGTSGTSGTNGECYESDKTRRSKVIRESNIDLNNFKLYLTDLILPGVNIGKIPIATQFSDLSRASKISFDDLNITMKISENLIDYNAILYWLYALHNPEEFNKISGRSMIKNFFQEIYVIITNNHREKVAEFKFIDAFPYTLSPLKFSYKDSELLTIDVAWAHSGMLPSDNFVLKYV